MFVVLLLVGFIGFVAMTALSFVHAGGAARGHHAGVAHHGHNSIAGHAAHHGGPGHAADRTQHPAFAHGHSLWVHFRPWNLLSPLDLFSLALGAGATGILLQHIVPASLLNWFAFAGALIFDFAVIKPIIAALLRFATKPSEGLEGTVAHSAEALTHFDAEGRGLVRLELDGQIVQLLATLDPTERSNGVDVSKGDEVVVTQVDPKSNTCRVTRELAE